MKTTLRKCRKDLRLTNSVFETDQLTEFMNLAPEILASMASIHRRHCAVQMWGSSMKALQKSTEYNLHIAIGKTRKH